MDSHDDISTDDTLAAGSHPVDPATAPTLGLDENAVRLESANTLEAGDPPVGHVGGTSTPDGLVGVDPRYIAERELGRGGMGRVMLVHDSRLKRRVALKEFLPDPDARSSQKSNRTAAQVNRFLREVQLSGCLEHPSIVPVHDVDTKSDGSAYYTMRYIEGRSLAEALKSCRGPAQRLHYLPNFRDICNAMAYAHDRRIIHRDLKPANVILGTYGETIVVDWGLAKVLGDAGDSDRRFAEEVEQLRREASGDETVLGTALGTPNYMAPEQALGKIDEVDQQSDIYSLGAMLYELLTGAPPFAGGSVHRILMRTVEEPLAPVRSLVPDAPLELCAIAEKALAKEKSRRYASCDQLAQDLTAYLSGEKVSSYVYSSWELVRRFVARNKVASSLVVLVFIILAVAVVLINGAWRDSVDSEKAAIAAWQQAEQDRAVAQKERTSAEQARLLSEVRERQTHYQLSLSLLEKAQRYHDENNHLGARVFAAAALIHNPFNPFSAHRHPDLDARATAETGLNLAAAHSLLFQSTAFMPAVFIFQFSGHQAAVNSIAVSIDGRLLASGGNDKTVKIWDLRRRRLVSTFTGIDARLLSLAFSPDGRLLAAGDAGGAIHLLDPATNQRVAILKGHENAVFSVRFSPDGRTLASGGRDRSIVLWEVASQRLLGRLTGHADSVNAISFSPDGKFLASGSLDKTVRLWDPGNRKHVSTLQANQPSGFSSVAFSPDGRWLAAGDLNCAVTLWNPGQPQVVGTLSGRSGTVSSLAFSPDGRVLASSTMNQNVMMWNLQEMRLLSTLTATDAPSPNSSVSFTPDGAHLITSGDPGVKLWAVNRASPIKVFSGHLDRVFSVAISPDGRSLATCGLDRTVRLWDIGSGQPVAVFTGHERDAWSVVFSPDGKYLATGSRDRSVRLWDIENRRAHAVFGGHQDSVVTVAFSPDGKLLASASFDKSVRLWNIQEKSLASSWTAHDDAVIGIAFSRDGRRLITGSWDKTVKIWDHGTKRLLKTLSIGAIVTSVIPLGTSMRLAVQAIGGKVGFWDAELGKLEKTIQLDDGNVVISPDERMLLSVENRRVRLLEIRTEQYLQVFSQEREAYFPAFAPDGRSFALPMGRDVWIVPIDLDHWKRDPRELLKEAEIAAGLRLEGSRLVPLQAELPVLRK